MPVKIIITTKFVVVSSVGIKRVHLNLNYLRESIVKQIVRMKNQALFSMKKKNNRIF